MTYYLNPVNGQNRFVYLNGEYYLLSDSNDALQWLKEKMVNGDYCYDTIRETIWQKPDEITCNGHIYLKIIFTTDKNLQGVKKINLKVDVEKIAERYANGMFSNKHLRSTKSYQDCQSDFIAGYNSKQGVYSEDDLRKAFEAGHDLKTDEIENRTEKYRVNFEQFLESLSRISVIELSEEGEVIQAK